MVYFSLDICIKIHEGGYLQRFTSQVQKGPFVTMSRRKIISKSQTDFTSLHCLRADSSLGTPRQMVGSPGPLKCWEQLHLSLQGLFLTSGVSQILLPFTWVSKWAQNVLFHSLQHKRGVEEKEPSVQDYRSLFLAQFDPILGHLGNKELGSAGGGEKGHISQCAWSCHRQTN